MGPPTSSPRVARSSSRALPGGAPGPYALQAAIAAVHDEAADVATTDWPQVVALYDVLARVAPSPLVELNRAVAVAMRDGPAAGLALLDTLAGDDRLGGYHLLPAARADLLAPAWAGSTRPRPPTAWRSGPSGTNRSGSSSAAAAGGHELSQAAGPRAGSADGGRGPRHIRHRVPIR